MKNKKYLIPFLLLLLGSSLSHLEAKEDALGIVNFATCITESKYGKQEQEAFESLKNQMTSLMEDSERQLNELAAKFNNPDYMDGLSPEGEQEMKAKFQSLQEELGRYQQQYYQLANQANYKLIQTMNMHIHEAAKLVAEKKHLDYVVNKDAVFFYNPNSDITSDVIKEMNLSFEKNEKQEKSLSLNTKQPAEKKD